MPLKIELISQPTIQWIGGSKTPLGGGEDSFAGLQHGADNREGGKVRVQAGHEMEHGNRQPFSLSNFQIEPLGIRLQPD